MTNWGGKRPGAGRRSRVPGQKTRSKNISLTDSEWELLEKLAQENFVTVNQYVAILLRRYLHKLCQQDQE